MLQYHFMQKNAIGAKQLVNEEAWTDRIQVKDVPHANTS